MKNKGTNRLYRLLFLFVLLSANTLLQAQMSLQFDTSLSTGTTITLPLYGTVNVTVNWGDGTPTENFSSSGDKDHTYATDGVYTVTVSGILSQFGNGDNAYAHAEKLVKVTGFGSLGLTSLSGAFYNTTNLEEVPASLPSTVTNLSYAFKNTGKPSITKLERWNVVNVTNMAGIFQSASNFNQDINGWNVSNVTNMYRMFRDATSFNKDLNNWEVDNVTTMEEMFRAARNFNGDISNWNVSNVENMANMFNSAIKFNTPINNWNVGKVTNMSGMFSYANAFNQNLNDWDVSKVTNMSQMFYNATSFNGNIQNWNVSKVINMSEMFRSATHFNNYIGYNSTTGSWNVRSVTDMSKMFYDATSFNQDIGNWDVSSVTNMSEMFRHALSFNKNIGGWNVINVNNMARMFYMASLFNQDISTWNVINVNNMAYMFFEASAFDQNISSWQVDNVTDMRYLFYRASSFNQNIGNWNVAQVTNMGYMFYEATSFDQDIGNWDVSHVTQMGNMFYNVTLSTPNYNNILMKWSALTLYGGVQFHAGNSQYSSGDAAKARASIIENYNWNIHDGGEQGSISWNGSTSSDWNTASNWDGNSIPTSANNVVIPNVNTAPEINSNGTAQCNDLTIYNNATLTVNATKDLTVHGNLYSSGGDLILQSTNLGNGSLIVLGNTIYGKVITERYINGANWSDGTDGWHFLSSPVPDYPIQPNFTEPYAGNYDFYTWSEPDNLWVNFKNGTTDPTFITINGSNDFELGQGYLVAYNSTDTKEFNGKINIEDVHITGLTHTENNVNSGWHLLGNPFPSALIWDGSSAWNKTTNISGVAQIWSESGKSYVAINPGDIIPPTNGFMVQVTGGTGSLTIPKSKRVHNTHNFYKTTQQEDYPIIILRANSLDNPSFQESQIRFNPKSTPDFDVEYDGMFLQGYAPVFYSLCNDKHLCVNSIPSPDAGLVIPLVFIKNNDDHFSIELYKTCNFSNDIWLFDKKTNRKQNLYDNPVYAFTADENDNPERFEIRFKTVGTEEYQRTHGNISVFVLKNKIKITNPTQAKGTVKIFNLYGQNIYETRLSGDIFQGIPLSDIPAGNYVVRIFANKNLLSNNIIFIH